MGDTDRDRLVAVRGITASGLGGQLDQAALGVGEVQAVAAADLVQRARLAQIGTPRERAAAAPPRRSRRVRTAKEIRPRPFALGPAQLQDVVVRRCRAARCRRGPLDDPQAPDLGVEVAGPRRAVFRSCTERSE